MDSGLAETPWVTIIHSNSEFYVSFFSKSNETDEYKKYVPSTLKADNYSVGGLYPICLNEYIAKSRTSAWTDVPQNLPKDAHLEIEAPLALRLLELSKANSKKDFYEATETLLRLNSASATLLILTEEEFEEQKRKIINADKSQNKDAKT